MPETRVPPLAVHVVREVAAGAPADAALRAALTRTPHHSAPAERRAVSRAVFACFRWWRWVEELPSPAKRIAAALELQARFERNPAAFKPEALAARAVPDWVRDAIDFPSPAARDAWLRQLQREPALWLRVRAGRESAVAAALGDCVPARHPDLALPPTALRYTGTGDLFLSAPFRAGSFEIQDLASQLVGHACAPAPGETWWDACAGEGGKTLHLSDLMQNRGLVWASDRSARRLARLRARAARAEVFNYRAVLWDGGPRPPTRTRFDGVLVDAPCSGVGTWQRNPHARWTTGPRDVAELAAVQARLLDHVAGSLRPGGRLVYAVCTLTRAETTTVADAFTKTHPEFAPIPAWPIPRNQMSDIRDQKAAQPVLASDLQPLASGMLWPHAFDTNGMFLAQWRKS
jgi:16S rRNA (cytosine967-C5)-methyltransferase